jgi:hypothetical protein
MFTFILAMTIFTAFANTEYPSLEEAAASAVEHSPSDITRDTGSNSYTPPEMSTGKMSSVILESTLEDDQTAPIKSARLIFGGDVNEGRWGDNPNWHIPLPDSFVNLIPLFQDMDLVVFNAEGGLCDPLEGNIELEPRGSNILWVTPDSLIELQSELMDAKLVINQANNHSMNLGEPCLQRGTEHLSEAGIGVLGAGEDLAQAREPYVIEINGTVIGILAYADTNVIIDAWVAQAEQSGVAPMNPDILKEDMEALRPEVDFLIVTFHSGKEYERSVTDTQVEFALAAVQYDADLVVGHGSHVPQGVLQIDETPIYFGLGNGMMDQCFPDDYAFYHSDVRQNVWLEIEVRKSELVSIQPHVYYSTKCMVPSIASPTVYDEVLHVFENVIFWDEETSLSSLESHDVVHDLSSGGLVD